jgi:hypothetical protein
MTRKAPSNTVVKTLPWKAYEIDVVTSFSSFRFAERNQPICECLENEQYGPFSRCRTLYCSVHENHGTHPETDTIRSLYYLWCSYRGGV